MFSWMKSFCRKRYRNTKAFYLKKFYDRRFHRHKFHYIGQCLLASLVLLGVMISLNAVSNAVVVASIGATAFIVFTMPHKTAARMKYVFGGYIIGLAIGTAFYILSAIPVWHYIPGIAGHQGEVFGALAVGFTMFAMVMSNMEHAPAASLALGLVLDGSSPKIITVTLIAIGSMLLAKVILKRFLLNLL